ncbi:ArsR/SmtB family transcription factor [Syntrophomonas erecta]
MKLIQVMRALGDETRLRIFNLLQHGQLTVGEIETILGVKQSNVSRHLSRLKHSHLITYEKRAQWVYYQLNHQMMENHPILTAFLEWEVGKLEQCRKDLERLSKYRLTEKKVFDP